MDTRICLFLLQLVALQIQQAVGQYSSIDLPANIALDILRGRTGAFNAAEIANLTAAIIPGVNYPTAMRELPDEFVFNCSRVHQPGYYADMELHCQVYHRCENGLPGDILVYTYMCPEGKLFNQIILNCDWWYNVVCEKSGQFYDYSNPRIYLGPNVTFLNNAPDNATTTSRKAADFISSESVAVRSVLPPEKLAGGPSIRSVENLNPAHQNALSSLFHSKTLHRLPSSNQGTLGRVQRHPGSQPKQIIRDSGQPVPSSSVENQSQGRNFFETRSQRDGPSAGLSPGIFATEPSFRRSAIPTELISPATPEMPIATNQDFRSDPSLNQFALDSNRKAINYGDKPEIRQGIAPINTPPDSPVLLPSRNDEPVRDGFSADNVQPLEESNWKPDPSLTDNGWTPLNFQLTTTSAPLPVAMSNSQPAVTFSPSQGTQQVSGTWSDNRDFFPQDRALSEPTRRNDFVSPKPSRDIWPSDDETDTTPNMASWTQPSTSPLPDAPNPFRNNWAFSDHKWLPDQSDEPPVTQPMSTTESSASSFGGLFKLFSSQLWEPVISHTTEEIVPTPAQSNHMDQADDRNLDDQLTKKLQFAHSANSEFSLAAEGYEK